MKAQFITLEGIEGAGKSLQKDALCRLLDANGIQFIATREPGGTPYAEAIRSLLLNKSSEPPVAMTELLLMFAARAQHLERLILPTLASGVWVICDRFTDATYAYQGAGRQIEMDWIRTLESLVQNERRPDTTLIFDVSVDTSMARVSQRGSLDRIESENLGFFNRVRDQYKRIASESPDRVLLIDATTEISSVTESMYGLLRKRWGLSCLPG